MWSSSQECAYIFMVSNKLWKCLFIFLDSYFWLFYIAFASSLLALSFFSCIHCSIESTFKQRFVLSPFFSFCFLYFFSVFVVYFLLHGKTTAVFNKHIGSWRHINNGQSNDQYQYCRHVGTEPNILLCEVPWLLWVDYLFIRFTTSESDLYIPPNRCFFFRTNWRHLMIF